MPYSTLVITAGISAFAPRNEIGSRLRCEGSPLVFPPGKQNPEAREPQSDPEALSKAILQYLATHRAKEPRPLDPQAISAEFSMLHAIRTEGKLCPGALVHLIHTPTLGGKLAVELQKHLLEEHLNVQLLPQELPIPFDPAQLGGLSLASGAFIGAVSRLLKNQDPHTTAFAPIGGYKVMVALGHTAASFYGFSSLYLHEDSQVLQEIAPAPISITPEARTAIAPAARRVGNGAEWKSLTAADQKIITDHSSFFTRIEDLVELNELGQFIRLDAIPIRLHPEAARTRAANPSLITGQLHQILQLATHNPDHCGINHDLKSTTGRNHPWRLARMAKGIRIAWQIEPDALYIRKIWTDHDTYENEAPFMVVQPALDVSAWQPV